RSGADLSEALQVMHETVRRLGNPDFYVSALVARWRPATRTLTWVNCGHPPAYLAHTDASLIELESPEHAALGVGDDERTFSLAQRELHSGERLILVTDGITGRRTEGGGTFGADGIKQALAGIENQTACSTAMAVLQGVTDCWREPLEDDGTVAVLAID
ncbi:MAG TPA: PP2C family protein-serine/threonine phosphatase, partial [Solirubrobacteraceae bacterium]|nr:PP2C family protein-serine/threonine phosphatase [Solirubrobacteraceae bacterium]